MEKVLLFRYEKYSFYEDHTYRCDHWAQEDFSHWIVGEDGECWLFRHEGSDVWSKAQADEYMHNPREVAIELRSLSIEKYLLQVEDERKETISEN